MGFFRKILDALISTSVSDPYTDKGFDKKLKQLEKEGKDLRSKLEMAYSHQSIKSAYWWYDNTPNKPITGSDIDIELLHAKFKCSFEHHGSSRKYKTITKEVQEKFVEYVLPNCVENKAECVTRMMNEYVKLKGRHASPFITSWYWCIFHYNKLLDENGELIRDEDGKNVCTRWLLNFFDRLESKYNNKFDMYEKIDLAKAESDELYIIINN